MYKIPYNLNGMKLFRLVHKQNKTTFKMPLPKHCNFPTKTRNVQKAYTKHISQMTHVKKTCRTNITIVYT